MLRMKPIDQTTFGKGTGNCMAACVASVLELPLDAIPDLRGDHQYAILSSWLMTLDLGIFSLGFAPALPLADFTSRHTFWGTGFAIAGGKSPRGDFGHAVVMRYDGKIVHDPHPSRAGIENIDGVDFIVPKLDRDFALDVQRCFCPKQ